jgi:SAM domain (Sterile alpha motif)
MTDIAGWLSGLGLAQCIPLFAENDIDIAVLAHLGDDDLKELGISFGHRRKLLRAATALGRAPAMDDAGRRQLTVMFADLAGSTALSTLRASLDLAASRAERGEREAALELVSAVYERFQEGFEMPDLKTARARIVELQGG